MCAAVKGEVRCSYVTGYSGETYHLFRFKLTTDSPFTFPSGYLSKSGNFVSNYFACFFLTDSPLSSIRKALCTSRSQIASAIVASPIISCQLFTGNWEEITVDPLPCLSSMISKRESLP